MDELENQTEELTAKDKLDSFLLGMAIGMVVLILKLLITGQP